MLGIRLRKLGNSSIAHVEILDYIKGSYEYLTHESKDAIAKNKHIYDKKNILHINDFDLDRYITLDESQKKRAERSIGRDYKSMWNSQFEGIKGFS